MDRFFNLDNLKHYHRLTGVELAAPERKRILEALAEQWDIFRRECRGSTVDPANRVRNTMSHFETGVQDADTREGTRQCANLAMRCPH